MRLLALLIVFAMVHRKVLTLLARQPKGSNPHSIDGMIEMLSLCEEYQIPNQSITCEKEWQAKDVTVFQMIVDAFIRGQLKEKEFAMRKLESLVNAYVRMTFNITPSQPGPYRPSPPNQAGESSGQSSQAQGQAPPPPPQGQAPPQGQGPQQGQGMQQGQGPPIGQAMKNENL